MRRDGASTAVSEIQTPRRSARKLQLNTTTDVVELPTLGHKWPSEAAPRGGNRQRSTRRKVLDNDTHRTEEISILIVKDEKVEDTKLDVGPSPAAGDVTLEDFKETIEGAADLRSDRLQQRQTSQNGEDIVESVRDAEDLRKDEERPHKTSKTDSHTRTGGHAGRLDWERFVKLPSFSTADYVDRYPNTCAIPLAPSRLRVGDMVKPPGPTRPLSIHQKATPQKKPFDLTGPDAFDEPAAKRHKTNDLGFPATYGEYNNGSQRNGAQSTTSSVNGSHERLDGFNMGGSEFRNLDKMMHGNQRRKGTQHTSRQSSRQNTIDVDDDIEDDGPIILSQAKPQSMGYEGNARPHLARTQEQKSAAAGETAAKKARRRNSTAASPYFGTSEEPSAVGSRRGSMMVGGGNVPSTPKLQNLMHTHESSKRRSHEIETISDDEDRFKKPRRGSQGRSNMAQPRSGSLSKDGDIPPTFTPPGMFKRASHTMQELAQANFPVHMVQSTFDSYQKEKNETTASLAWSPERKALILSREGQNFQPELAIGMDKIAKITCSITPQDDGLFLLRQKEPYSPVMLIRLNEEENGPEFLSCLLKLSSGADVLQRYKSEQMERVALNKHDELEKYLHNANLSKKPRGAFHEKPEDIRLLESRASARYQGQLQTQSREATPNARPQKRLVDALGQGVARTTTETERTERPRISESAEPERKPTRSTRSQRQGQRSPSPYKPTWTESNRGWREIYWKGDDSLIYPSQGDKRATVDRQDIIRLNEGEFLNDNVLQFYLRYLEEKIKTQRPEVAKRVLFMNPFFYQRLTKGKGRSHIDYDGIKRWTAKVDVFAYDYVIVPVNEHAHWYLAIICNTPAFLKPPQPEPKTEEVDTSEAESSLLEAKEDAIAAGKRAETDMVDEVAAKVDSMSLPDSDTIVVAEDETATKVPSPRQKKKKRKSIPPIRKYNTSEPRIITMDSLGLSHSPTCSNLREFLVAEAKARKGVDVQLRQPSVGMTAKNIPEQDNHCDCGLFLLGYVEHFLQNPDGTMHDIMQQRPEVAEHFRNLDASKMRGNIRQLIFDLKKEQAEREKAEKQARIEKKKKAKAATEAGGSVPPTAEPTPAASPERSVDGSAEEPKMSAAGQTIQGSKESTEEPSIIEVQTPSESKGLTESPSKKKLDPMGMKESFQNVMDDMAGCKEREQASPESQESFEDIGHSERNTPQGTPYALREDNPRRLPTQPSVECLGEQPKALSKKRPEFACRDALKNVALRGDKRDTESLPSSSPGVVKTASAKKGRPQITDSMPPIEAPSAFKGPGRKVGAIGPPRRGASSDLDAPPLHAHPAQPTFYVDEDDNDPPCLPRSSKMLHRPKQSSSAIKPSKKSNVGTPGPQTSTDTDDEAVEIPVKIFTPKAKPVTERVKRAKTMSSEITRNAHGGTHTKFADSDDTEMLMDGSHRDDDEDSLVGRMSPNTVRASAQKTPAVEIPHCNSEVNFNELPSPLRRNHTPSPRSICPSSSPKALRSSPRSAKGRSILSLDALRQQQRSPPPRATKGTQKQTRALPPAKTHKPLQGSQRSSPRQAKGPKNGKSEQPITIESDDD